MNVLHPAELAANPAAFLVRVEMPNATWEDYDALHVRMRALGFEKEIVSDGGQRYRLPDAEYFGASILPYEVVRDMIQSVVDRIRFGSGVLVTETVRLAWRLDFAA